MNRLICFSLTTALFALGAWLSGCSDNSVSGSPEVPLVVSVSPKDGATDVPTADLVVITFNTVMDTMSVMGHFHCAEGDEMWEWMDSLQHHGPGPGGHMGEMDHMMDWMRDIQLPGEFRWNDDMTECTFHPDEEFSPQTDCMIYLEGDVRSHAGMMMDMHHLQFDAVMIHFRTGS